MEQFRQIGEVLGSLKALMVLHEDIQINQRQCCLLLDMFRLAYKTIAEEIKGSLRLEEKNTKWKALEHPLRELHRIFKEGEFYIRNCLDYKDWWGKAISLHQNKDCVEFHIHNLLCCFPTVIEAIESAQEISGLDNDEMLKRRLLLAKKYDKDWNDPKLFQWKFGKQYMVFQEICKRLDSAWREDKWLLLEIVSEKRRICSKNEQRLGDLLVKKLNVSEMHNWKLFPSSILVGSKDYQVRRRLGGGSQYKEIIWLGESFALRHFFGDIEPLNSQISSLLSLSHPNITQYLCGFYEEEKKECFLVMELMNKDLCAHIKENCGPRRRIPLPIPIVIDLMLQIARGMEYLHSRKIYHGELNPSNVLLKPRKSYSTEGYFRAKVSGFGLSSINNHIQPPNSGNHNENQLFIWYAPEVLAEQEQPGSTCSFKYTEKADVYSFGMLCFELLTGKVPFEEGHLQGDKMGQNIRAGERPLFPFTSPKYLVNLTKKCWQTDPNFRPSFSSICRILRDVKRFLVMNPDHGHPQLSLPLMDFCEIEARFLKKFSGLESVDLAPVSQIPFQMFAYRLLEKEKARPMSFKDKSWESASEAAASMCGDENGNLVEDQQLPSFSDRLSFCSEVVTGKKISMRIKKSKSIDIKARKKVTGPISFKDKSWESASEAAVSMCGDENGSLVEDQQLPSFSDRLSVCSEVVTAKKNSTTVKKFKSRDVKATKKVTGTPKGLMQKSLPSPSNQRSLPSRLNPSRSLRTNTKNQLQTVMSPN